MSTYVEVLHVAKVECAVSIVDIVLTPLYRESHFSQKYRRNILNVIYKIYIFTNSSKFLIYIAIISKIIFFNL